MRKFKLFLLTAAVRFQALFPLKVHYFWADFIAWILRNLVGYRREIVSINLGRAFPYTEKYYDEVAKYSKEYYRHMAEIIVEAIWFAGASPKKMYRSGLVSLKNVKAIEEAYSSAPSVVVLYSHCGNWELMGGLPHSPSEDSEGGVLNIPEDKLRCVYKALSNKVWDDFFRKNRTSISPTEDMMLESKQLLRYMLSHRNEKLAYFLNIDQRPDISSVDMGQFLNQPTRAFLGPAEIAHKFGYPVFYMNFERTRRGHYDVSFIKICDDASAMSPKDIIRRYYDCLEAEIRRCPPNWLWSHKRWV